MLFRSCLFYEAPRKSSARARDIAAAVLNTLRMELSQTQKSSSARTQTRKLSTHGASKRCVARGGCVYHLESGGRQPSFERISIIVTDDVNSHFTELCHDDDAMQPKKSKAPVFETARQIRDKVL
jgi:hypothetical protein